MSDSNFPLTKALGLTIRDAIYRMDGESVQVQDEFILVKELEKVLREAPVVSNNQDAFTGSPWTYTHGRNPQADGDTHTARLLCVQPIVRDTAESLLRELVETYNTNGLGLATLPPILERARALLGNK